MDYAYTPASDMAVFLSSAALLIVLHFMYHQKSLRYRMVLLSLYLLMAESLVSAIFHFYCLENLETLPAPAVYLVHHVLYIGLILELVIFLFYLDDLIGYHCLRQKRVTWIIFALYCVLEVTAEYTHVGFYIENGEAHQATLSDFYVIWCGIYILMIFITIVRHNRIVVSRIYSSIFLTFCIALLVMVSQVWYHTESFTTLAYFVVIMVTVILFHSSSYNTRFGALDRMAIRSKMKHLIERKEAFLFVQIVIAHFHTIEDDVKTAEDFKDFVRYIDYKDFLFRVNDDSFVMIFPKDAILEKVQKSFEVFHEKYQLNHTITVVESNPYCQSLDDYMALCEVGAGENFYRITESDLQKFHRAGIIRRELADIEKKGDLLDSRVKVYCQPILDIGSQTFTMAESLMRLELDELGFLYPDVFIPIAEAQGTIHALTKVILNKVCRFIEEHPDIERISVNFSMVEIVKPHFYEDIYGIISKYSFDFHKLGFEVTESFEAEDFEVINEVLMRFKRLGITIYLDDFGTGYSNIEHITKMPIDVIKFDRSLVTSSGENKTSEYMISSLSNMFSIIGYDLLYEGIEHVTDQRRCIGMKAGYLQGYRYSRPIPIDELGSFINKPYEEAVSDCTEGESVLS